MFAPVKLHTKGRLVPGPHATVDGDVVSFRGGSTALVKILEPLNPMLNYYELEIVDRGNECAIGIGCGVMSYPQGRMPGWNRDSMGYHGDDGKLFHERGFGQAFGERCTTGDRMGCGVDFVTDAGTNQVRVFFTKNGQLIKEPRKMRRPLHGLYPLIGLHSRGEKVRYLGHQCVSPDTLAQPMEHDHTPSSYWLRSNGVKFLDDGLTLEYDAQGGNVQDVSIAQANFPINPTNHYFQLDILNAGDGGAIAIGLAKTSYPLHRHPGWNSGGVGYHADDGKLFIGKGDGSEFGPTCTTGDTMGCGVRYRSETDSWKDSPIDETESDIEQEEFEQCFDDYSEDDDDYSDDDIDFMPLPRRALLHKQKSQPASGHKEGKPCTVYFTKNGEEVGEVECVVPQGGFYPVVAMLSRGERISVNFEPFSG